MEIVKCKTTDCILLSQLNKQLIEDERSDNTMTCDELEARMKSFIENDEYAAYFFIEGNTIIGYALVKNNTIPKYLRQFFIIREYRRKSNGKNAFFLLLNYLKINIIDIEVLDCNEIGKLFWKSCGFKIRSISMRYENDNSAK